MAAFHRLTHVTQGDRVKVVRRDHSIAWFKVDSVRRAVRRSIEQERSHTGRPELRLISWRDAAKRGGHGDPRNVIVSAHLDRPAGTDIFHLRQPRRRRRVNGQGAVPPGTGAGSSTSGRGFRSRSRGTARATATGPRYVRRGRDGRVEAVGVAGDGDGRDDTTAVVEDRRRLAVLDAVCGRARPSAGSVRLPGRTTPRVRHARRSPPESRTSPATVDQADAGPGAVGERHGRTQPRPRPRRHDAVAEADGRAHRHADPAAAHPRRPVRPHRAAFWRQPAESGPGQWLDADPAVFALDDPDRGVDVGARAEMHEIVRDLANDGKIILIAATDLTELVDLCDRVLVFQRGEITDEIDGPSLSEQALSRAMNAGFAAPF